MGEHESHNAWWREKMRDCRQSQSVWIMRCSHKAKFWLVLFRRALCDFRARSRALPLDYPWEKWGTGRSLSREADDTCANFIRFGTQRFLLCDNLIMTKDTRHTCVSHKYLFVIIFYMTVYTTTTTITIFSIAAFWFTQSEKQNCLKLCICSHWLP